MSELKTSDKDLYPHRVYLLVEYTSNNENRKKKYAKLYLAQTCLVVVEWPDVVFVLLLLCYCYIANLNCHLR